MAARTHYSRGAKRYSRNPDFLGRDGKGGSNGVRSKVIRKPLNRPREGAATREGKCRTGAGNEGFFSGDKNIAESRNEEKKKTRRHFSFTI